MSAPPPEAAGVAAATDELAAFGICVVAEHCSGRVWPAALTLFEHLMGCDESSLKNGAKVLELGAGTGWLAVKVHKLRPDLKWCATETQHEHAAERLASNLEAAFSGHGDGDGDGDGDGVGVDIQSPDSSTPNNSHPTSAALDWSAPLSSKIAHQTWDVVCGSDLVYGEEGARDLSRCLAVLLKETESVSQKTKPAPTCLIAQTCGRWGGFGYDACLYDSLQREGLHAVAVGGELLADSDELKQHVVVFDISVASQDVSSKIDAAADEASHPLLRARRLRLGAEAAAEKEMTEEDISAEEASKVMGDLEKLLE